MMSCLQWQKESEIIYKLPDMVGKIVTQSHGIRTTIPLSGNENAYSGLDVAIETVDNLITTFRFCTI